MNKIFVSIIVPVFKTENYLRQCIDSILAQTYKNFELIIVDDGSPDKCPEICDEYSKIDSRISVFHQPNRGQANARKFGLKKSKGDYIFFVDSDDWLEPNAIEIIHDAAIKNNADIITFDSYFNYSHHQVPVKQPAKSGCFDKDGLKKHIYPTMIYSGRFFYFGIYAAMWNKVFRRSVIESNVLNVDDRIKIGEDGVATFAAFLDANRVCVLGGQYLYHYRDNNISVTRSYCTEQFNSAILMLNALYDISKKKNVYDLKEQIDYYLLYNVRSIFYEEFYYRYKKSFSKRYKYLKRVSTNKQVRRVIEKISTDNFSGSTRLFVSLLRRGKFNLLIILTLYITFVMRLKLFLRKFTKRY